MLSSLDQNKSQMQLHQQMLSRYSQLKELSKTAQRVILDLKEKVLKLYDLDEVSMSQSNTNRDEALSALEVLGFVRKTSEKIIENSKEDPEASVESIIKSFKKLIKSNLKNTDCMYKLCTFFGALFCGSVALAQVNEQKQDTTKTGYSIGKVQIKNPQSVLSLYI
jgi:hypothetical protein